MRVFDCLSAGLLLALAANMTIIIFLAFFNGYECLVVVDRYGEALAEVILFPLVIIMGAVTLVRMVKAAKKEVAE